MLRAHSKDRNKGDCNPNHPPSGENFHMSQHEVFPDLVQCGQKLGHRRRRHQNIHLPPTYRLENHASAAGATTIQGERRSEISRRRVLLAARTHGADSTPARTPPTVIWGGRNEFYDVAVRIWHWIIEPTRNGTGSEARTSKSKAQLGLWRPFDSVVELPRSG